MLGLKEKEKKKTGAYLNLGERIIDNFTVSWLELERDDRFYSFLLFFLFL